MVFDEKLINIFLEDKFISLFKRTIELCIDSKIIYTNFYLNHKDESLSKKYLKTIPETLLDILIKLIKSDVIKNSKEENKIKDFTLIKTDIISFLYKIFFTNIKSGVQKDEENKRSLFIYNDLYRYFFDKKIKNPENELKSINKNKKKYDYNFITFNIEKIYLYRNNTEIAEYKELSNFLYTLLSRIIIEHEILYQLNKDFFFFKKNSEYSIYNNIKERLKQVLSSKKKLVDSEVIIWIL